MREGQIVLLVKAFLWQTVVWLLAILALFLPAGTLAWPAGWAFFSIFFGFVGGLSIWLFLKNLSLLAERLTILSPGQKHGDKVWLVTFYILSLIWLSVMPLDAIRLHWLGLSAPLTYVGVVLLLCSEIGIFLTLRENSYASPVVRLQQDRGQVVVDTGVYSRVRHPLYTSACLFYVAVPLLFNSGVGLMFVPVFVGMLMFRSVQEERVLQGGLPGYNVYKERVPFRFIPGIW